jgi:hypothetical protein
LRAKKRDSTSRRTEINPDAAAVERVRAELGLAETPIVPDTYVEMAARHGAADADGCRRLLFST